MVLLLVLVAMVVLVVLTHPIVRMYPVFPELAGGLRHLLQELLLGLTRVLVAAVVAVVAAVVLVLMRATSMEAAVGVAVEGTRAAQAAQAV